MPAPDLNIELPHPKKLKLKSNNKSKSFLKVPIRRSIGPVKTKVTYVINLVNLTTSLTLTQPTADT